MLDGNGPSSLICPFFLTEVVNHLHRSSLHFLDAGWVHGKLFNAHSHPPPLSITPSICTGGMQRIGVPVSVHRGLRGRRPTTPLRLCANAPCSKPAYKGHKVTANWDTGATATICNKCYDRDWRVRTPTPPKKQVVHSREYACKLYCSHTHTHTHTHNIHTITLITLSQ